MADCNNPDTVYPKHSSDVYRKCYVPEKSSFTHRVAGKSEKLKHILFEHLPQYLVVDLWISLNELFQSMIK